MTVLATSFASEGTTCAGTHHVASVEGPRPCVVLGHGFAMTRGARLERYAARFAAAGLDALTFDYRTFGGSAGEPRQWMDVRRQLADWRAAVAHARSLPGVDRSRIALWGTSFSGGHVVAVAASDPALDAVVSQIPFSGLGGGPRKTPKQPLHLARVIGAALLDAAAAALGRHPHYLPVLAPPGQLGAFDRPGAAEQVAALVNGDLTWENRFTPRVLLALARYHPFARGARVRCPVLLVLCDPDEVTPAAPTLRRAGVIPSLTVEHHDCAHFEIYQGEHFERCVKSQIAFLCGHLA